MDAGALPELRPSRALISAAAGARRFLLAKDAGVTDPVCSLSPQRGIVDEILKDVNGASYPTESSTKTDWIYRSNPA